MARSDGPNFIDGFSSVQAVKRSKTGGQGVRTRQSSAALPSLKAPTPATTPSGTSAKRISRSTMPEKFQITCYECEYSFTLQGRVIDNFCPKCHEKLLAGNISIEKEWAQDVKTIGRVEIKKGAALKPCKITTRDLMLEADATAAELNVYNRLELANGASFNVKDTVIRILTILKNTSINLKGSIVCDTLEVLGTLKANIKAAKSVTVEKGGFLKGTIESPSLVVAEGAALNAKLKIGSRKE